MSISTLQGLRIHIAGAIHANNLVATRTEATYARIFLQELVKKLIVEGANFAIPVGSEDLREDEIPVGIDWLIWETILANNALRPHNTTSPLALAMMHQESNASVPRWRRELWAKLRDCGFVESQSVAHWNTATHRTEIRKPVGDVLLVMGGAEGVKVLANIYHDAGKPVIPLDLRLSRPDRGARSIFAFAKSGDNASQLFQTKRLTPQTWINRLETHDGQIHSTESATRHAQTVIDLLKDLTPPSAFAVRLLDTNNKDWQSVQNFFDTVVEPVIGETYGYTITVIDGSQPFLSPTVTDDIFRKLHYSPLVIADLTSMRPNCLLELGYALGRGKKFILMAQKGADLPFDLRTVSTHFWDTTGSVQQQKDLFRKHLDAVKTRPPLVKAGNLF